MEQINKYRSPIVLGVLIMFLLLFAFFMLSIQPTNNQISTQQAELERLNQETEIFQNKINELKSNSNSGNSEQDKLLAALPQGDDSEGLILNLSQISSSAQVRLTDISFITDELNPLQDTAGSTEVLYPTVKQMKMVAAVQGTYTSIHKWMNELQDIPRIVNIDSFSFQEPYDQPVTGSPESILTANIAFTAYFETKTAAQQ